jgi:hypothetical protein
MRSSSLLISTWLLVHFFLSLRLSARVESAIGHSGSRVGRPSVFSRGAYRWLRRFLSRASRVLQACARSSFNLWCLQRSFAPRYDRTFLLDIWLRCLARALSKTPPGRLGKIASRPFLAWCTSVCSGGVSCIILTYARWIVSCMMAVCTSRETSAYAGTAE